MYHERLPLQVAAPVIANLHELTLSQTLQPLALLRGTSHVTPLQRSDHRRPLFPAPQSLYKTEVLHGVFFSRLDIRGKVEEAGIRVRWACQEIFWHHLVRDRRERLMSGGVYILATPLEYIRGVRRLRKGGLEQS